VLAVVLYPIFLKLIYIVSGSNSGGILSVPAALLDFSLLIIVHMSLYFCDDTSWLSQPKRYKKINQTKQIDININLK